MFQAKCISCDFPIEPGDQYLEAMGGTYHVECFNCSVRLCCYSFEIYSILKEKTENERFISKLLFPENNEFSGVNKRANVFNF
jgi:LIM domain-containing protein